MEDRYLNLIIASVPIIVALVTVVGLVLVEMIKKRSPTAIVEGDKVAVPDRPEPEWEQSALAQAWQGRLDDKDARIRELEAEVDSERAARDKDNQWKNRIIAKLREWIALDDDWHRRHPHPEDERRHFVPPADD